MKKKIFYVITLITVAAAVWSHMGRDEDKAVPEKAVAESLSGSASNLEQKVLTFAIDGRSSQGVRQWHLEGNSAEIAGETIHLKDLKAVAYGDGPKIDLTSDSGIYRKEEGEVELLGNVKVFSDDGGVLKTDSAKWSQLTKNILSKDAVYVEREGMIAMGKGAIANFDEKAAALLEDVEVVIIPDTTIKCIGPMKISYQDNTVVFHNKVEVEDKDGKLFADKLTAHIDPVTRKLAEVIAEGNVKVRRGGSYTICEKAIYADSTKSVRLIGKPRVVIEPDDLNGLESSGS